MISNKNKIESSFLIVCHLLLEAGVALHPKVASLYLLHESLPAFHWLPNVRCPLFLALNVMITKDSVTMYFLKKY